MSYESLSSRMAHRWRDALPALGIEARYLVNRSGPCPACQGRDRFRWDNKEGRGTYYCNQCGPGDGASLAMMVNRWTFVELAERVEAIYPELKQDAPAPERTPADKRDALRTLWRSGRPLDGQDPASRYLTARCGSWPPVVALRHVAACTYYPGPGLRPSTHPALVAAIQDAEGKMAGLHRTYLTIRGGKAPVRDPRKTMGDLPDGCAIRLCAPAEHMAVAEGIETALSVTALSGLPCWSAVNAGRLAVWTPPPEVEAVSIYGDSDASGTGQEAAWGLCRRLRKAGIAATVHLPPNEGQDWNDVHAQTQAAV